MNHIVAKRTLSREIGNSPTDEIPRERTPFREVGSSVNHLMRVERLYGPSELLLEFAVLSVIFVAAFVLCSVKSQLKYWF